jgi:hypothetical protein
MAREYVCHDSGTFAIAFRQIGGRPRASPFGWIAEIDLSKPAVLARHDLHEHLGQLIAYARTNHIVPPWSN